MGKEVGFTGDFDKYGGVPVIHFLTKEIPWVWTTIKCSLDYLNCGIFYFDPANREEEQVPTVSTEFPIISTPMPRMFLLTKSIAKLAAQGNCTPWEARLEGGKEL